MAKGLFLMRPAHGHVNPTIGLVSELLREGDEITYICGEEFREKFKHLDIKFIGFNNILNNEKTIQDRMVNMLEKNLEINKIELELALKEQGEFDYVVVDPFIMPGEKLLKKFNIKKTITTTTTFGLSKNVLLDMGKYLIKNVDTIHVIEERLKNIKSKFIEVEKEFGIHFSPNPIELLIGDNTDLKIVFTSKYFQPHVKDFDSTYKFVGPSIYDRHDLGNFKVEKIDSKKLIFISLGTIANENTNFYKECFKALGNRDDLNIIMSIGNKVNINDLGIIPENFKIYNHVPQLEVLKYADLFITHGGMNSTNEGLYNNLPLIIVPQFADQPLVAKRVEELGAGIALMDNISANSISEAVNKILLNNSYKENAKKIGQSLKECGGYKKAVQEIHSILK